MTSMPPDTPVPLVIEWRVGSQVLTSLPGRTDLKRSIAKPFIPTGCTGWRRITEEAWHALSELPKSWNLDFLSADEARAAYAAGREAEELAKLRVKTEEDE